MLKIPSYWCSSVATKAGYIPLDVVLIWVSSSDRDQHAILR